MTIDPAARDLRDVHRILIGAVVPRPIALVSTISSAGIRNVAPFSFFNAVCSNPPVVLFSTAFKGSGPKDTLRNAEETGDFVVNIVSEAMADRMNLTSGDYPPDVDEFAVSGFTPLASELVRSPRVAESPVQMECRLLQVVRIHEPAGAAIVLGQVVRFHVDDRILDGNRIDPAKLQAIGRMGGLTYCRTTDRFDLDRPVVKL